jgi:hypothetical protein
MRSTTGQLDHERGEGELDALGVDRGDHGGILAQLDHERGEGAGLGTAR